MPSPILASACLLGIRCRYDGKRLRIPKEIKRILKSNYVVFVCPEQLGGLRTPRPKNYIFGEKVIDEKGTDVTENFLKGAKEVLRITRTFKIKTAYLKAKSPSCGENGITKRLLERAGIKVILI